MSGSGWQLQSAPGALKSSKKQEDAGQKMDVMQPLITPARPSLAKQTGGDRAWWDGERGGRGDPPAPQEVGVGGAEG